jgi:hypothetical protein
VVEDGAAGNYSLAHERAARRSARMARASSGE